MPNAYLVARAAPHLWEEPILSGTRGAGNIFFSGCTMACCFCQNHQISQEGHGYKLSEEELIQVMLRLQAQGVHNIGLVTADHYLHRLPDTLRKARQAGVFLPFALNTSSYITVEALRALEGLVDIFLPDLKYRDNRYAVQFSRAPRYWETATAAIAEMFRQTGPAVLGADGLLQRGLIVRHLALPGLFFDSRRVLRYLAAAYGDNVYISLMNQYIPLHHADRFQQLSRRLNEKEYDALLDVCDELGIEKGFRQEATIEDEASFVPAFDGTGILPDK